MTSLMRVLEDSTGGLVINGVEIDSYDGYVAGVAWFRFCPTCRHRGVFAHNRATKKTSFSCRTIGCSEYGKIVREQEKPRLYTRLVPSL